MGFDPRNLMYVTKSYETEVKNKVAALMASNTTASYLDSVNTELDDILKKMSDKLDTFEGVISGVNGIDTYSKEIQTSIDNDKLNAADLLDTNINNTGSHPSTRANKETREDTVFKDLNFINKNISLSSFSDVSMLNTSKSNTDTVKEFKVNMTDDEYIKVIDFSFGYKQHPTIVDISNGSVTNTENTVTINRYISGKFFIIRTDVENNPQSVLVKALIKNADNTGNIIDEKIIDVKESNENGKTSYITDMGPEFELFFKVPSRTELDICIGKIIPYRYLIRKTYVENGKTQEKYISTIRSDISVNIDKILYSKNLNTFILIDDTNSKIYYTSDSTFDESNYKELTTVSYSQNIWVKDAGSYVFIGNGTTTYVALNNITGLKDLSGNYTNPSVLASGEYIVQKDNSSIYYFNSSSAEIGSLFGEYHTNSSSTFVSAASYVEYNNSCVVMISNDVDGNIYYRVRKPSKTGTYASTDYISDEQIINIFGITNIIPITSILKVITTASGIVILANFVGNASKSSSVIYLTSIVTSTTDSKSVTFTSKILSKFDIKAQTSSTMTDYITDIIDTSIMTFGITSNNKLVVIDKNYVVDAVRFDEETKEVTTTNSAGISTTETVSLGYTDKYSVINLNTDDSTDEYFLNNTAYLQNVMTVYESSSGVFIADSKSGIYELQSNKEVRELLYITGTIKSICNNSNGAYNDGFILMNDPDLNLCIYKHDFSIVQTPENGLRYVYLDLFNGKYVKYTTDTEMLVNDTDDETNGPTVKFSADLFITFVDRTGSIYTTYENTNSNISYNETALFGDYNPAESHTSNFVINNISNQRTLNIETINIKPNKYGFANYNGFDVPDDIDSSTTNDEKNLVMIHKYGDSNLTFDDFRNQTMRMIKDAGDSRETKKVEYSTTYKPDTDKLKYIPQQIFKDLTYTSAITDIKFGDNLGKYLCFSINKKAFCIDKVGKGLDADKKILFTTTGDITLMKCVNGIYFVVESNTTSTKVYIFTLGDVISIVNGTTSIISNTTITGYDYSLHGNIIDFVATNDSYDTVIMNCEKASFVYRCRDSNNIYTKPFSETTRVHILQREELSNINVTATGNLSNTYTTDDGVTYLFGSKVYSLTNNSTVIKYTDGGVWKLPDRESNFVTNVIPVVTPFNINDMIEIDGNLFFSMNYQYYLNVSAVPSSTRAHIISYNVSSGEYTYYTDLDISTKRDYKFYKTSDGSIYAIGENSTLKYNTTSKKFVSLFDYKLGSNILIDNNMIWTYITDNFNTTNVKDDLDYLCYYDTSRDERKPVYLAFSKKITNILDVHSTAYGLFVTFLNCDSTIPIVYRISEDGNETEHRTYNKTFDDNAIYCFSGQKGIKNNFRLTSAGLYKNGDVFSELYLLISNVKTYSKYTKVSTPTSSTDTTEYYNLTGGRFIPLYNLTAFPTNYNIYKRISNNTVSYTEIDKSTYICPCKTETYYTYNQLTLAYVAVTGLTYWDSKTTYYSKDSYYKLVDASTEKFSSSTTYYRGFDLVYTAAFSSTTGRVYDSSVDYYTCETLLNSTSMKTTFEKYIPEIDKLFINCSDSQHGYTSLCIDCTSGKITYGSYPIYYLKYTTEGLFAKFDKTCTESSSTGNFGLFDYNMQYELSEEFSGSVNLSDDTSVIVNENTTGLFVSNVAGTGVYKYDYDLHLFNNNKVLNNIEFDEIKEVNGSVYGAKKDSSILIVYKYNTETKLFVLMFDSVNVFKFGGFGTIYDKSTDMYTLYAFGSGYYNVYKLSNTTFIPCFKKYNKYNSGFNIVINTDNDTNKIYLESGDSTSTDMYCIDESNEISKYIGVGNLTKLSSWMNDSVYTDTLFTVSNMYISTDKQTDFTIIPMSGYYISDKIIDKTTYNDFTSISGTNVGIQVINYKGIWIIGCVSDGTSSCSGILYSIDGLNWKNNSLNGEFSDHTYMCDGMLFIGTDKSIYSSIDGVNLIKITTLSGTRYTRMAGKINDFYYLSIYGNYIYYSKDGIIWNHTSFVQKLSNIIYFNNKYIAIDETGHIYYSNDFEIWNDVTTNYSKLQACNSCIYNNLVIYGSILGLVYSADGLNYKLSDLLDITVQSLCCNDSIIIAGSITSPYLYYSTDGKTWKSCDNTSIGIVSEIIYYKNIFILSSSTGIWYSTDGKTWTQSNITESPDNINKYIYDGITTYKDKIITTSRNNIHTGYFVDKYDYKYNRKCMTPIDKESVLPISINGGKNLMYSNSFANKTSLLPENSLGFTLYDSTGSTVLYTNSSFEYIKDTSIGIIGVLSTGEIFLNTYYIDSSTTFNKIGTGRSGANFRKIIDSSLYGLFYIDDKNSMKYDISTNTFVSIENTITNSGLITFAEEFDDGLIIASNNERLYAVDSLNSFGFNVYYLDDNKFEDLVDPSTMSSKYITGISQTSKGIFIVVNTMNVALANNNVAYINTGVTSNTNIIYRMWKKSNSSFGYETCSYNTVNPINSSYPATHPVDMSQVVELENGDIILCRPTLFRNSAAGELNATAGANEKTNYESAYWIYKLKDANSSTADSDLYGTYYQFEISYETSGTAINTYINSNTTSGDCDFTIVNTSFGDFAIRDEHCFDYQTILSGTPTIPYTRNDANTVTLTYNSLARVSYPTNSILKVYSLTDTTGENKCVNYRTCGVVTIDGYNHKYKLVETATNRLFLIDYYIDSDTTYNHNGNARVRLYEYNKYTCDFDLLKDSYIYDKKLSGFNGIQVNGNTLTAYDTDYNYDRIKDADVLDYNGVIFLKIFGQLYRYGAELKISSETLESDYTNRKICYEAKLTIDNYKDSFNNLNEDVSNTNLDKFVINEIGIVDASEIEEDSTNKEYKFNSFVNNNITQYFDPHNYYNYWNGFTSKVDNNGEPLKEEDYSIDFKSMVNHIYNGFNENNLINSRYIVKNQKVISDVMKHSTNNIFGEMEDYIKNLDNAAYRIDLKIYPAYSKDKTESIPTNIEKFNS